MDILVFFQEKENYWDFCSFIMEFLTYLSTIVAMGISIYVACFARREYLLHKKSEKANTLARYNERYSTNEVLKNVVEYLWKIEDKKESYKKRNNEKSYKEVKNEIERYFKNNTKSNFKIPTEHEKELFLRFFEEIQFSIEEGALDKKQVYELFYYYAKIANDMGEDFVEDYNKDVWRKFRAFIHGVKI